jgi:hypothetical protein
LPPFPNEGRAIGTVLLNSESNTKHRTPDTLTDLALSTLIHQSTIHNQQLKMT